MILEPGTVPWTRGQAPASAPREASRQVSRGRAAVGAMAHHAGVAAEFCVARHYERCGSAILAQRWRGTAGEIDLVAQDADGLIFIEVKKSRTFDSAVQQLSARQIRRVRDTGLEYADHHAQGSLTDMRFHVALMNDAGDIQVIENAFL